MTDVRPLVFVNYRTKDEAGSAALIRTALGHRFGPELIFHDGASLRAGERFPDKLLDAVRNCDVLLAVIGPRWIDAADPRGGRALDREDDWIRREITEAFHLGARVIPVLVAPQTAPLNRNSLPPDLASLADVQFRRLDPRESTADLARLGEELAALVPELAEAERALKEKSSTAAPDSADSVRNSTGDVRGSVVQAGEHHDQQSGGHRTVAGDNSTVVNGAQGPVHSGTGPQYNGPSHHGPQITGDGTNYVAGDNQGGVHQRYTGRRKADEA